MKIEYDITKTDVFHISVTNISHNSFKKKEGNDWWNITLAEHHHQSLLCFNWQCSELKDIYSNGYHGKYHLMLPIILNMDTDHRLLHNIYLWWRYHIIAPMMKTMTGEIWHHQFYHSQAIFRKPPVFPDNSDDSVDWHHKQRGPRIH